VPGTPGVTRLRSRLAGANPIVQQRTLSSLRARHNLGNDAQDNQPHRYVATRLTEAAARYRRLIFPNRCRTKPGIPSSRSPSRPPGSVPKTGSNLPGAEQGPAWTTQPHKNLRTIPRRSVRPQKEQRAAMNRPHHSALPRSSPLFKHTRANETAPRQEQEYLLWYSPPCQREAFTAYQSRSPLRTSRTTIQTPRIGCAAASRDISYKQGTTWSAPQMSRSATVPFDITAWTEARPQLHLNRVFSDRIGATARVRPARSHTLSPNEVSHPPHLARQPDPK
jgi:hypothetical protein